MVIYCFCYRRITVQTEDLQYLKQLDSCPLSYLVANPTKVIDTHSGTCTCSKWSINTCEYKVLSSKYCFVAKYRDNLFSLQTVGWLVVLGLMAL